MKAQQRQHHHHAQRDDEQTKDQFTMDKRQTYETFDQGNISTIAWANNPLEWTPCEVLNLSWTGGMPPYTLVGSWWPDGQQRTGLNERQWSIVERNHNTSYEWRGAFDLRLGSSQDHSQLLT